MSAIDDGGPAFPAPDSEATSLGYHGLSTRDWFAGQALVGMTASPELMRVVTSGDVKDGDAFERLGKQAYRLADAMLAARKEGK